MAIADGCENFRVSTCPESRRPSLAFRLPQLDWLVAWYPQPGSSLRASESSSCKWVLLIIESATSTFSLSACLRTGRTTSLIAQQVDTKIPVVKVQILQHPSKATATPLIHPSLSLALTVSLRISLAIKTCCSSHITRPVPPSAQLRSCGPKERPLPSGQVGHHPFNFSSIIDLFGGRSDGRTDGWVL